MADRIFRVVLAGDNTSLVGASNAARDAMKGAGDAADQLGRSAGSSRTSLQAHARATGEASSAAHEFSLQSASAKRELLVLVHEASQGNFKQLGGSLLVLAEQTGAAGALFTPMGLAIAAAAVAAAGLYAVFGAGAAAHARFNASLQLTGNYAGVTASSFDAMQKNVAASTDNTVGKVHELLQALVSTGKFGPDSLEEVAKAASNLERLTGASAESIVAQFVNMRSGVAKWALESNSSYHFLTAEQYAYIERLEEQGHAQEAASVALKAFNTSLDSHTERLGYAQRAWRSLGETISDVFHSIKSFGAPSTTQAELEAVTAQIARAEADHARPTDGVPREAQISDAAYQRILKALRDRQTVLQSTIIEEGRYASAAAASADQEERRAQAYDFIQKKLKETKSTSAMQDELDAVDRAAALNAGTDLAQPTEIIEKLKSDIRQKYMRADLSAAKAAAAELKSIGEGQLEVAKQLALSRQQESLQDIAAEQDATEKLYQTGQINAVQYYDLKASYERTNLDIQRQALSAELDAAQIEEKSLARQGDLLKNKAKQLVLETKIAAFDGRTALVKSSNDVLAPLAYQQSKELREANQRASADLILDDQARAKAQLDVEIQLQRDRIDQQFKGSDEYQKVMDAFDENVVLRQAKLAEDLKPEWQKMVDGFNDSVQLMRKASDDFTKGFVDAARDAFVEFGKTGRFSVSSLVDYIRTSFLKLAFDRFLGAPLAQLGNSLFNLIGGAFGLGGGGSSSGAGVISSGSGLVLHSALGNAFDHGRVQAFAAGGILGANGGVLTQPTVFPMSGGLGIGGEAGVEAVMPLTRGPNGKLGVMAQGASKAEVHEHYHFETTIKGDGVSRNMLINAMAYATDAALVRIKDAKRRGDRSV
jgi:phage-related minor tail protein